MGPQQYAARVRFEFSLPIDFAARLLDEASLEYHPPERPITATLVTGGDRPSFLTTPFILKDFDTSWRGKYVHQSLMCVNLVLIAQQNSLQDLYHAYRDIIGIGNRSTTETEALNPLVQLLERQLVVDELHAEGLPKMSYESCWIWHADEVDLELSVRIGGTTESQFVWEVQGINFLAVCSEAHRAFQIRENRVRMKEIASTLDLAG